jgi:hypothetical protein
MARWEYRFINLYRGKSYTGSELSGFTAEVAQAGLEGWEAVGEVSPCYGVGPQATNIPVLMLKRRVDE